MHNTQPRILVLDADSKASAESLCDAGFTVATCDSAKIALEVLQNDPVDAVVLGDCVLEPGQINLWPAVPTLLSKNNDQALAELRPDLAAAKLVATQRRSSSVDLSDAMVRLLAFCSNQSHGMVAADPQSVEVATIAARAADTNATILLLGESGVGKEVFARHIHRHSGRSGGPFVALNCAAIPESMLEAMLFGHEKGSYTGATESRPGKFELANGGTLLLDEVSEMSLPLQAKLLRVLQEQEVERIGARQAITLDVRVIATSNTDIRAEVRAGRFRQDLFFRLSVFPLTVPPLRHRPLDIRPLALRLLAQHTQGGTRRHFSDNALRVLEMHNWMGNVRELGNVVQRALILERSSTLHAGAIVFESFQLADQPDEPGVNADLTATQAEAAAIPANLESYLESRERELILAALSERAGSRKDAAQQLGISPRTLRNKLSKMRAAGVAVPG